MARRRIPSPKSFEQYPNVYARTSDTYTTRYYQRKTDAMFDMLGLCTVPDIFHKKPGSSPYLRNVRYLGEREDDQRAQVMSRKGAKLLVPLGEDVFDRAESEGDTYLDIREGKAIQYIQNHNKKLTGLSHHLYNIDGSTGFVKITVRDANTFEELANGVIDAKQISTRGYSHHHTRFIKTVTSSRVIVRMEILDDVDNNELDMIQPEIHSIRVLATHSGEHSFAYYNLPNADKTLEEIPYEFQPGAGIPLTGVIINDWEPMLRGKIARSGGRRYKFFPVRHNSIIEIYKTDIQTNETTFVTNLVNPKAKQVRFERAEGYLYYVDGISPYRRINLTTLVASDVVPLQSEITAPGTLPSALTAKVGASLIHFLNNRMYLSGFADDPNLVVVSLIDDVKPRFEQFNDRFYSPDQSPELSAGSPITALADFSDLLVVFRSDGNSLYTSGAGYEAGGASQATPEAARIGVLNQEAICQGNNNIYGYSPVEGVFRYGGNNYLIVSQDVENLMNNIKHKDKVFMLYNRRRVRMYHSMESTTPDSCFYYYVDLQGQLPWYYDNNTPVLSAEAVSDSSDVFAIHSEVSNVMQLDTGFTDFDSYIKMEYSTHYRAPDSPNGWVYLRRTHLHEIADTTHSLYVGIDTDYRDKPAVWRKYIKSQTDPDFNPDAVFQQSAEEGNVVMSIHTYIKCRRYQIRISRYCYKDTAEFLGISTEFGNKDAI